MDNKIELLSVSALLSLMLKSTFPYIISLLVIMTCDYATGIIKSLIKHNYNSSVAVKGIIKKLGYVFITIGAMGADTALYYYSQQETPIFYLTTTICIWLITNDFLSTILNIEAMGVKLPKAITDYIKKIRGDKHDRH